MEPRRAARDFVMVRPMRRDSGQAVVETALSLPLVVFIVLGVVQLFLLLQGRLLAQFAAGRAVHAGAVSFGSCKRMTDAAILSLMPSFHNYLGAAQPGGSVEEKLANAFAARRGNRYAGSGNPRDGSPDTGYNGDIVWLYREQPEAAQIVSLASGQDLDFDQPGLPMRLEVRMIYWFPLRVPFADWVLTRAWLAQWGVLDYTAQNPLLSAQRASWRQRSGFSPEAAIKDELRVRAQRGEYVFPISSTYTMRMMTPAAAQFFQTQNCPPLR
jgi:hypothetical protein